MFDNSQLKKITLLDKKQQPYISLEFNSPLVAVWSPSATYPNVPFVCIEPWYGRCDTVGYEGEFKDREWMQHLAPGKALKQVTLLSWKISNNTYLSGIYDNFPVR